MSGHGFKLAPVVGEMMAAIVTGVEPPVSAAPFRLDRSARPATAALSSPRTSGDGRREAEAPPWQSLAAGTVRKHHHP